MDPHFLPSFYGLRALHLGHKAKKKLGPQLTVRTTHLVNKRYFIPKMVCTPVDKPDCICRPYFYQSNHKHRIQDKILNLLSPNS